jgi:hypothetical protein
MAKKVKASQHAAVAKTGKPSKMDGSITNEELARQVIEGVRSAKLTAEDLLELRERFAKLKKAENIVGYQRNQWEKFCKEKLGMSAQKARRWLRETCKAIGTPTPGSKHDGSANRTIKDADGNRITKDGKPFPLPPWTAKTPDGTLVDVARSAAHAAIRDGDEQTATYWMRQLYLADRKVWKALDIFSVEDVGLADLSVKTHVLELQRMAESCKDERNSDLLHVLLATMICCRAKKNRNADDAAIWFNEHPTFTMPTTEEAELLAKDRPQPPIPDKVFDRHTTKGRKMGRGMEHFKEEKAVLKNRSNVVPFTPPTGAPCPHCSGTGRLAA